MYETTSIQIHPARILKNPSLIYLLKVVAITKQKLDKNAFGA